MMFDLVDSLANNIIFCGMRGNKEDSSITGRHDFKASTRMNGQPLANFIGDEIQMTTDLFY